MTTKQMRELDAWIAENVMGWKRAANFTDLQSSHTESFYLSSANMLRARNPEVGGFNWNPTTDPAAAMEVLKKCQPCSIHFNGEVWFASRPDDFSRTADFSTTLELAICQFAKKLFTKEQP